MCTPILWTDTEEIERTKQEFFFTSSMKPAEIFVEEKIKLLKRLPTDKEFKKWATSNYPNRLIEFHSTKPTFIKDWGRSQFSYMIGAWKSDSILYYRSWDKKLFYGEIN